MKPTHETIDETRIGPLFARLAEGIGKLVSDHLRLTRLELTDDVNGMVSRIGVVVFFAVITVVGYALLCAATAIFAGRWLGPAGAWLLVAGLNLVAGGVGLRVARAKLRIPARLGVMLDEVTTQAQASITSLSVRP